MWFLWSETLTPLQTLEFLILLPEAPGYLHGVSPALGSVPEERAWCTASSWMRDQNASHAQRVHLVPSGGGEDAVAVAERQLVPSPRASASTSWAICKAQRLGGRQGRWSSMTACTDSVWGEDVGESLPQTASPIPSLYLSSYGKT